MVVTFKDPCLSELFTSGTTKDGKYKKLCRNKKLVRGYIRAVEVMYAVESTEQLRHFSFLHYEKLKHQHGENRSSVRILNGAVERLIFTETNDGIEVELIEIDSTHYGNK